MKIISEVGFQRRRDGEKAKMGIAFLCLFYFLMLKMGMTGKGHR